ncbi:hypothetical protein [Kribbella sp. CA-247076]|uniref:hypothetical protein n=1 Tax=Kribbella sp. CA-247076 TaxID=3239941 RepID=UPI003D8C2E97
MEEASLACSMHVGTVTAGGDHTNHLVTAGSPPTMTVVLNRTASAVYAPGQVRLSSTFVAEPDIAASWHIRGWVVQGGALYSSGYALISGMPSEPRVLTRIGGGWTDFKALEEAELLEMQHGQTLRTSEYGLTNDGRLFRWQLIEHVWRRSGEAGGFASVKAMALISTTRAYDTFLVNTRGGALYTVRIPTALPLRPVVKVVRTKTWQVFETLLAVKCGLSGTLLLGIDKDTQSGYLYAVGHANGLATVIQGLGKVQGTFPDPVDFRWRFVWDPLNGE